LATAPFHLLAPMIRGRKGEYRKSSQTCSSAASQRVKVDGEYYELEDPPKLDKKLKHDIDVVVDRIVIKAGMEQRLAESFETALGLADGIAIAEFTDKDPETKAKRRMTFSAKFACPVSGFTIPEIEPRLFSFNNPFGACPACDGLGEQLKIDPNLVVPETDKASATGAIAPWGKSASPLQEQTLKALAKKYKFSLDTAWNKLPERAREIILFGTGEDEVDFVFDDGVRRYEVTKPFEGVVGNLERAGFRETDSAWMREEIGRYQSAAPCPTCMGERLRPKRSA
jgi:excinuclease ABC subunit A